jgi:YidC/Oxa1 family membrane protein insertase
MRLIMVPLFVKQMHTTRAMSALAPEMQALRKKYKNDKQTLQQETMKLYQQAGVNPLMGCLPVVLQLPMFFALYSVLKSIAEWKPGDPAKYGLTLQMVESAQHAKILGATIADKFLFTGTLHVPLEAKAVILLAVLISMTTTFLTVRQSQKRGMMPAATPDNPMGQSQKYMMYIMPFFALSGLYWPFGLVLYWVTTNCWTLMQQWVLFRRFPTPIAAGGAAAAEAPGQVPARGHGPGRVGRRPVERRGKARRGPAELEWRSARQEPQGSWLPGDRIGGEDLRARRGRAYRRAALRERRRRCRRGPAQARQACRTRARATGPRR